MYNSWGTGCRDAGKDRYLYGVLIPTIHTLSARLFLLFADWLLAISYLQWTLIAISHIFWLKLSKTDFLQFKGWGPLKFFKDIQRQNLEAKRGSKFYRRQFFSGQSSWLLTFNFGLQKNMPKLSSRLFYFNSHIDKTKTT